MKHILFVDDEQRLLDALQRMLRPHRHEWEMRFVASGEDAITALEGHPCDVIVTDMRMPGMDGAALLEYVRGRYPAIIRILLSGYFELEAAMRAVSVAHQFLAKPCDPQALRKAIERSCYMSGLLADEAVRRVVGAVGRLPSLPRTCAWLAAALERPDVSLEEISRIIEQDVGISAKILQLANSAFFGVVQEISTVTAAISYLGFEVLRQLVLSAEVFRTFQPGHTIPGFSLADLQEHSRRTANLAARFPAPKEIASAAVVAGLLHDSGKLVLAARLPKQFALAFETAALQDRPMEEVERELAGASHAEIGAYLLGLWGLPGAIVDAVARHHHPPPAEGGHLTAAAVVHIADALAHHQTAVLDPEYLRPFAMGDAHLAAWQTLAGVSAANPSGT